MSSFDQDLKQAQSIQEIFAVCNKHYITEEKMTFVKLLIIKAGIKTAIDTIKPQKR